MTKLDAKAEKDLKGVLADLGNQSLPDGVRINFGDPEPFQQYTAADAKADAEVVPVPVPVAAIVPEPTPEKKG